MAPEKTDLAHPKLSPKHIAMLKDSGISDEVRDARGYETVTTLAGLRRFGFGGNQLQVPTLLIRLYNVFGELSLYAHRPDTPRLDPISGKGSKYLFAGRSKMILDVHPNCREKVRDPRFPLIVTEGPRKADSAVSAGGVCITLLGVWNFRGTNEYDGLTTLPDWEGIALKDREGTSRTVYVVFDSDAMQKRSVHQALKRLGEFLKQRGAYVLYVYLPFEADGQKVGLDDYLAAGHTLPEVYALASPELRALPTDENDESPTYSSTEAGFFWNRVTREGTSRIQLSNFRARIVAEVTQDDGTETHRLFEIEGQCKGEVRRFLLTPAEFSAMLWPMEQLGADAFLFPGFSIKEHARIAIQTLSTDKDRSIFYTHTGWREIKGQWAYLHGGGAIASSPIEGVSVRLPDSLKHFRLPPLPSPEALRSAIKVQMRLLHLAPDTIIIPLLACGLAVSHRPF